MIQDLFISPLFDSIVDSGPDTVVLLLTILSRQLGTEICFIQLGAFIKMQPALFWIYKFLDTHPFSYPSRRRSQALPLSSSSVGDLIATQPVDMKVFCSLELLTPV